MVNLPGRPCTKQSLEKKSWEKVAKTWVELESEMARSLVAENPLNNAKTSPDNTVRSYLVKL